VGTATLEIQEALVTLLSTDSFFAEFPIYEEVPENQPFPYTVVVPLAESTVDTFDAEGRQVVVIIHLFDDQPGYLMLEQGLDRLETLVHHRFSLPLGTYAFISSQMDSALSAREPDGITRHLVVRITFLVEEL
jgi:hypothetical protein